MAACKSWRETDPVKYSGEVHYPASNTKGERKPPARGGEWGVNELRQKMACKGCWVMAWLTSSGSYKRTGDLGHTSLKPLTMGDISK